MRAGLTGFLLLAVCAPALADDPPVKNVHVPLAQILKLDAKTAAIDAKRAAAQKDTRLYAVYGFTITLPGVTNDTPTLRSKYGLRLIEGTSDALADPRQAQWNNRAKRYAAAYNRELLLLLQ